jgi:hypothetical protein
MQHTPESSTRLDHDCYEIVRGMDEVLREGGVTQYYVLGGMAAKVLQDPGTIYDHGHRIITASKDLRLPSVREENGTLRDIDVLIPSANRTDIARAEQIIRAHIGNRLDISVFGFEPHELFMKGRFKRLFSQFLSTRTMDQQGVLRYVLGPLSQEVNPESYQPWELRLPHHDSKKPYDTLSVLNPAATITAYQMRSITGVRPKDAHKLAVMKQNVLAILAFKRDVSHGPLKEWDAFAEQVEKLSSKEGRQQLHKKGCSSTELTIAGFKVSFLHNLEKQQWIVNVAQHPTMQRVLSVFVGLRHERDTTKQSYPVYPTFEPDHTAK